jgi:Mor family transcriptional regulator
MNAAKKPRATGSGSPTPQLDALLQAEPDLVDRIFEYICHELPELAAPGERLVQLKIDVRAELAGERQYIAKRGPVDRQDTVMKVLQLFNGRNATEVARQLQIGRATVYRILKRPGHR